MPFPYYTRLSARGQAIYRQSDRVAEVRLRAPGELTGLVATLRAALDTDSRSHTERAAAALAHALLEQLRLAAIDVRVLAVRPRNSRMELHGLYTYDEGAPPEIRVWMRTARQRRVVAFRSFLRTLLHELCHHLDFRYLKLADSYHTEGFFRRESSLFRQLVPEAAAREAHPGAPAKPKRRQRTKGAEPAARRVRTRPAQQRLPFD